MVFNTGIYMYINCFTVPLEMLPKTEHQHQHLEVYLLLYGSLASLLLMKAVAAVWAKAY